MCSYDKYQIIDTLGQGTFGKVKLAEFNGQHFAIKFSTKSNAYSSQVLSNIFEKQAGILGELNHPNIIKLHEVIRDGNYMKSTYSQKRCGLVFEYAPYNLGEILQYGPLGENIGRTLFHQLINSLNYLHSNNIIHRDIKPQNILFDQNYNLKIADFGLSTKIINDNKPKTICGSDSFKSPELLLRKNYNGVMNDLFAAGVTLFILIAGNAPFHSATPNHGFYKFIALNYLDKFWISHQKKVKFSSQLKNLIASMLAFDPTHRMTISEIMSHPWMTGDILMGEDLQQEMRKIQNDILIKKRKKMLNNLQNKPIEFSQNAHRCLTQKFDASKIIQKRRYRKQLAKPSDRYIPIVKTLGDLERILQFIEGDMTISGKDILLTKITENQNFEKLTILINIENIDEQSDCLKFKLRQGDYMQYFSVLQNLDERLML